MCDRHNLWLPKWIRRNYDIQNKDSVDATAPSQAPRPPSTTQASTGDSGERTERVDRVSFPHADVYTQKFIFEPCGEPLQEEDPERVEERGTDYHWRKENREPWQLHSEEGPNIDAEGKGTSKPPLLEEIVNPLNPDLPYDRHWRTYDQTRVAATWQRLREESTHYPNDTLDRHILNDDHQQLCYYGSRSR